MKNKIFKLLEDFNISYDNYEHEPVFSCDDNKGIDIPGARVKSLLIRNKKGHNYYMIVLGENKKLNARDISDYFEDTKMSFASEERMMHKIGLKPGNVSPFALVNNEEKDIKVVFDEELKGKLIGFHPLQNDNTVVLNMDGVEKFLEELGAEYFYMYL